MKIGNNCMHGLNYMLKNLPVFSVLLLTLTWVSCPDSIETQICSMLRSCML